MGKTLNPKAVLAPCSPPTAPAEVPIFPERLARHSKAWYIFFRYGVATFFLLFFSGIAVWGYFHKEHVTPPIAASLPEPINSPEPKKGPKMDDAFVAVTAAVASCFKDIANGVLASAVYDKLKSYGGKYVPRDVVLAELAKIDGIGDKVEKLYDAVKSRGLLANREAGGIIIESSHTGDIKNNEVTNTPNAIKISQCVTGNIEGNIVKNDKE